MPAKLPGPTTVVEFERTDSTFGAYIDFPDTGSGSLIRLSKHYFVELLATGRLLGIHRREEYPTFFKLFRRYSEDNQLGMKLSMRQVRDNLWLLIPQKASAPKPGNMPAASVDDLRS